ncbi:hypothetical protein [Allonocardiopsis opalescens]|uniref:NACHT domain-containing protein n=1 Tax=Allonocardiopsis opalescens TaxID=1144618 RepID=A0A2T0QDA9_9ACTN|nr:hypothetical protein [Allonocardiopsis opalescens]PRY01895.1 hypothetical protein CLV72_101493 [Allonocardiopsis opalescens]
MNALETPDPRRKARRALADALAELYSLATTIPGSPLTNRQICEKAGVDDKRFSAWRARNERRIELPSLLEARRVIAVMEEHRGEPLHPPQHWTELLQAAQKESQRSKGGRPGNSYRPTAKGPFHSPHTAERYKPQALPGRQAELDRLHEWAGSGAGYLSLVAPPWSGKTALLATFVMTCTLPKIDLVAYFVRWKTGSDNAQDFLRTMCTELGNHVGTQPAVKDAAALLNIYDAAARKSVADGRKLLLVVDGLDEDAEASPARESIASLLPPRSYTGLLVLVSRRHHPPLPDDVPQDHPLRSAERISGFRPSPEAVGMREAARRDLEALLTDRRPWVPELVGFLVVADGGLTQDDLLDLVESGGHNGISIPAELENRLRSVAARGFCAEDLDPDTLVLAHADLLQEALYKVRPRTRTALSERLHAWADGFRKAGWPASTPGYLLHHYANLLERSGDAERYTAFARDHRRLVRLAARGRVDLALASLDRVAQRVVQKDQKEPTPVALASVAASRSLLEADRRLVPREVLHALCVVGDEERAGALAVVPGDPVATAHRLVEVVKAVLATKTEPAKAVPLVKQAAESAEQCERQPYLTSGAAESDTPVEFPRLAVVLVELGLAGRLAEAKLSGDAARLFVAAVRSLVRVDRCRQENAEAVVRATCLLREAADSLAEHLADAELREMAAHLAPYVPDMQGVRGTAGSSTRRVPAVRSQIRTATDSLAEHMLDDLLSVAETQAAEEQGGPVLACVIRASVAAHEPGRAEQVLRIMKEASEELLADHPGPIAVRCLALTASAFGEAGTRAMREEVWKQARGLVATGKDGGPGALDPVAADELGETLALLVQALFDLGERHAEIRDMLVGAPDFAVRAWSLLDAVTDSADRADRVRAVTEGEGENAAETEEELLLEQMSDLSALGDGPRLRRRLDEFMRARAVAETRVPWLPFLAEALAAAAQDIGPALAPLTSGDPDGLAHVRVLVSAARGHAAIGRRNEALEYAVEAARIAERLKPRETEAWALLAQVFAHLGDAEKADLGAGPGSGVRPRGRPGDLYRRAALAVQLGLRPTAFVDGFKANGLPGSGITAESKLSAAFRALASGDRLDARMASLKEEARTRLASEPLIATGYALLQAGCGDTAEACRTAGEVPDAETRGIAQVTVAAYLSGFPVYPDVAGSEDRWRLSLLRSLAYHLRPKGAGDTALVRDLLVRALDTPAWYWALPLMGRSDPEAVQTVVEVLEYHQAGADSGR